MKKHHALVLVAGLMACGATPQLKAATQALAIDGIVLGQGMIAGEVTSEGAILQARLTQPVNAAVALTAVPGVAGVLRFEYGEDPGLSGATQTPWQSTVDDSDFIGRTALAGLKAGTRYHYAVRFGRDAEHTRLGPVGTFKTLPPADAVTNVRFAVVSCFTYWAFHYGRKGQKHDIADGYPALAAISKLKPDYLFLTGDNVYYDAPPKQRARTLAEMRGHWQRELSKPRLQTLLSQVGSYWQKDDHDYRFNDADNTNQGKGTAPSPSLGAQVFREQVPQAAASYRTYRIGRLLQVWLLESREFRSPNKARDGQSKTLWGAEQKAWLMTTLKASDAPLKLIITPTPMVGPDDAKKRDNHTNPAGFRHEGQAFLDWVGANFAPNEVTIFTGDRHWRYHSIDPHGIDEFSCGAICDAGSRMGRAPGDAKSTDPEGKVQQPYTARRRNGGFLYVDVKKAGDSAELTVVFANKRGKEVYRQTRKRLLK